MPRITTIPLDQAKARLKRRTPEHADRAAYREAITNMTMERMIELEPEAGETLRKLRLNVNRAAKEVGRSIEYDESDSGTLLVWLALPAKPRTPRKPKSGSVGDK